MPESYERMTRLEEAQLFASRDIEELSAQVRELHELVAALGRRLEVMESWRASAESEEEPGGAA